jgi:GTP1/Obg family GTP-binding protein
MHSVEDYARRWAKSEKEELDSLSEWVKSIRSILKSRIEHVRSKMRTNYPSALNKPEVIRELNKLHEEYILVLADKACNNIVFVCKTHYHQCIINELGVNFTIGNRTYAPTTFSKDKNSSNPCIRFKYS